MHDYLDISLTDPDVSLSVKRWRARCRSKRQASVVVVRKGAVFYLEVRQHHHCLAPLRLEMINAHPDFGFAGGGSSSGGSYSFSSEGMPISSLDKIVALVQDLLETTQSDDMREALRRPKDPIAPLEEPEWGHAVWSMSAGQSFSFAAPRLRLRFPQREYECWRACLSQLFDGLPRPLPLCRLTAGRYFYWDTVEDPLDRRFEGLCPGIDADWRSKRLPFYIDPDSFEPGTVALQDEGIVVSRPGFSHDGEEAVFWLNGPLLSGDFHGLVRARLQDGQWRVVERSYDEDWERLPFDHVERPQFRNFDRPGSDWHWTCAAFQETEPHPGFYTIEELQASNAQFQSLVEDGDERCVIPMLHGPPMSIAQLKRYEEVFWTSTPSRVSETMARAGQAIIRWGAPDSPQWLGKLLYHLDQRVPCRFFESVWTEAPVEDRTEPHRKSLMTLLEAIFAHAGCAALRCRHTADPRHPFGWQAEAGAPLRILGSPNVFDRPGTLWMHIAHRGFSDGVFEILGALCRWGDPGGKWTQRLWRAAVIESAWSGIDEQED